MPSVTEYIQFQRTIMRVYRTVPVHTHVVNREAAETASCRQINAIQDASCSDRMERPTECRVTVAKEKRDIRTSESRGTRYSFYRLVNIFAIFNEWMKARSLLHPSASGVLGSPSHSQVHVDTVDSRSVSCAQVTGLLCAFYLCLVILKPSESG